MIRECRARRGLSVITLCVVVASAQLQAAETGGAAITPRSAAPIDLTGFWVSIVTEDWRYRMITAAKGDIGGVPLNQSGLTVANEWDPEKDISDGDACKAYGAAGIMRRPGRLHIYWDDVNTLKIDLDAGMQTRILHFAQFLPPTGFDALEAPISFLRFQPPNGSSTLQGYSLAAWVKIAQPESEVPATASSKGGALMVMTSHMEAGYLQKNGIPYSSDSVMTEYFDRIHLPSGEDYLIVTSIVEDPMYLTEPFITSTQFKSERDGYRWAPTRCDPK